MTISSVVLSKNAASNIENCLKSLSWSDEVVVIDDNSVDNTVALAKNLGAKVIAHPLNDNFAQQRNYALEQAKGDWVLFVDSDEIVSKDLAEEIKKAVLVQDISGYMIQRRDIMWGKEIKHGESGSIFLLRLARKGVGTWKGDVHETWQVPGKVGKLQQILKHYPHPSLSEFLSDINWYTSLRAKELHKKGMRVHWYDIILYPKAKFFQNYVLKSGFRDGTIGFILAVLMSFHSFLVRGKVWQLQKNN